MKKFRKTISFILALMIALAPVGITAQAVSIDTMKSKVLSVAENEVGYEGTSTYSNTANGTVIKARGAQHLCFGALTRQATASVLKCTAKSCRTAAIAAL
ncbi:MAG: hypothetical protein ACLRW3_06040 [Eubacterium sp.]